MNAKLKVQITFAIDMLWVDASEDDYDVDATESNFLSAVENELFKHGYDADCNLSNVSSMKIERDDEEDLGDDYHHIRGIIDSVEVDYIGLDQFDSEAGNITLYAATGYKSKAEHLAEKLNLKDARDNYSTSKLFRYLIDRELNS